MSDKNIYDNIVEMILKHFNDVIKEKYFRIITTGKPGDLKLSNKKCIIEFGYDSGLLGASFVNPEEKRQSELVKRKDGWPSRYPYYPFFSVWKYLYPKDKKDYSSRGLNLEGQIVNEKALLLERLSKVLDGDFSWSKGFKEDNDRITRKLEYMSNFWAIDHPVRIMFEEGDLNWEKAFDEHKLYLDKLTGNKSKLR